MIQTRLIARRAMLTALAVAAPLSLLGCESDSYLDPTLVGRWERTPVTMPILDRLDLRRNVATEEVEVSPVQPGDLIPDVQEYVIGSGDFITVSIFELINVGVTDTQNREIDETGNIRLPVVGKVKASGLSPSQLEERIIDILDQKGIMKDATVSVVVQQSRQNLYSIIGAPEIGNTRFGTYLIPQPNFRLLEAIALAGGVNGRTRRILIFRTTPLTPEVAGEAPADPNQSTRDTPPAPRSGSELIDDLLGGGDSDDTRADQPEPTQPEDRPAPPPGVESGLDQSPGNSTKWVYLNGEYVRVRGNPDTNSPEDLITDQELSGLIAQRIIEVPYDQLIDGDMRFNVVIRPGDVIRIPDQTAGFVYMMGQTNRPGAYTVPGDRDLTLKQLIASSGGLSALANPERVDLVRRTGTNQEITVRLNLAAIFHGNEPDIFIKADDIINVGSSGIAAPLAVIRNGFRFTYGFGFVLDRNFGTDVFGDNGRFNN